MERGHIDIALIAVIALIALLVVVVVNEWAYHLNT